MNDATILLLPTRCEALNQREFLVIYGLSGMFTAELPLDFKQCMAIWIFRVEGLVDADEISTKTEERSAVVVCEFLAV